MPSTIELRELTQEEMELLSKNFIHHPAAGGSVRQGKHELLRSAAYAHAKWILEVLPPGRERSLALTHIENAMYWSNAGLARG